MSQATGATVERAVERPAGGSTQAAVLLRIVVVPLLGFLCFGLSFALDLPPNRIPMVGYAIATGTLLVMVVVIDRSLPRHRRNLLLSIFAFEYFVFFVLPVFVFYIWDSAYTADQSPSPIPLTPRDVTRAVLAGLVSLIMLLIGYALPLGKGLSNVIPRMQREWSAGTSLIVAAIAITLGWTIVLLGQFGVIPARAGTGVLGAISKGSTFGIALIGLCYLRYRSRAALVMLAIVIPPTMFFNFFTSSKYLFLAPFVLLAITHVIVTRRLRIWWIAGFILIMSFFYPFAQVYRDYMMSNDLRAVEVIASPDAAFRLLSRFGSGLQLGEHMKTGALTTASRLDGIEILSVILRDAGTRVPYQNGRTLAHIPMAYVPRLLWPGKPVFDTGQWVTSNFGYGPHIRSSTGSTWQGEWYYNFGWPGMIVGMVLVGIYFRFFQEYFLGMHATIPAMLAGVVAILNFALGVGGSLLGPTNTVMFAIAPIILTHIVVRFTTPRPRRLPPPL